MSLLAQYDPPANLPDFDDIPGQREAWHRFIQERFDREILALQGALDELGAPDRWRPQFYSAACLDPGAAIEQDIVWNAFPKTLLRRFGRTRALEVADRLLALPAYELGWRHTPGDPLPKAPALKKLGATLSPDAFYRPQDEYCEWRVQHRAGRLHRVTFTSEPPESWQALFGGKLPDSEIDFPGDRCRLLDLYRRLVDPRVRMEHLILSKPQVAPCGRLPKGAYNLYNRWNTVDGIAHLAAPPNALVAEVNLGARASQRYVDSDENGVSSPDALLSGTGMGSPNRHSDPTIAGSVNVLARLGRLVTLANPVGLYMDHIDLAGWEVPGGIHPQDCIRVVRGHGRSIERLVVEMPTDEFDLQDVCIGGVPITTGGQVAECITVRLTGVGSLRAVDPNPAMRLTTQGRMEDSGNYIFVESRHGGGPATAVVDAFSHDVGGDVKTGEARNAA